MLPENIALANCMEDMKIWHTILKEKIPPKIRKGHKMSLFISFFLKKNVFPCFLPPPKNTIFFFLSWHPLINALFWWHCTLWITCRSGCIPLLSNQAPCRAQTKSPSVRSGCLLWIDRPFFIRVRDVQVLVCAGFGEERYTSRQKYSMSWGNFRIWQTSLGPKRDLGHAIFTMFLKKGHHHPKPKQMESPPKNIMLLLCWCWGVTNLPLTTLSVPQGVLASTARCGKYKILEAMSWHMGQGMPRRHMPRDAKKLLWKLNFCSKRVKSERHWNTNVINRGLASSLAHLHNYISMIGT